MQARRAWGRGGRVIANAECQEEIQSLQTRLYAIEISRKGDLEDRDDIGSKDEVGIERETPVDEGLKVKLLKLVLISISRPKREFPTYDGSLITKNLMDWISELDNCFEYEENEEYKRVKFDVTRLKGHATLWWENV